MRQPIDLTSFEVSQSEPHLAFVPNTSFERTRDRYSANLIRRRARRSTQPLEVGLLSSRLFHLSLGPLSLIPIGCLMLRIAMPHIWPVSADDAWNSLEFMTSVPIQWLDPWGVTAIASGAILAIVFCVLMRGSDRPTHELKPIWVVLLFAAAPISLPVFWFSYLRASGSPTSNKSLERMSEE
jgi:hypothetical protein